MLDSGAQLPNQVVDDGYSTRLGRGCEFAGDEFLTEYLTQIVVGIVGAPLPPRADLGRTGKELVEFEVLLNERRAERWRGVMDQPPAQQSLPIRDRDARQQLVERLEEFRLPDVELLWWCDSQRAIEILPFEVRRQRVNLPERHPMVVVDYIAQLNRRAGSLGKLGFYSEHRVGFSLGCGGVVTDQLQHPRYVVDELRAQIHRGGVGLGVVLVVGK